MIMSKTHDTSSILTTRFFLLLLDQINAVFYFQSDLPATVRVVQERMLEVLKENIKDKAREEKERKIMKRSKKVKFFGKGYD